MELVWDVETAAQQVHLYIKLGIVAEKGAVFLRQASRQVALVTDENLAYFHAKSFFEQIKQQGVETKLFVIPAGEKAKSREVKAHLEDQLIDAGFGSDTTIVAFGGGVVTDLAGFVAATYCRGVPLVLIPTSLLAMVDASLGGKTAVNAPNKKNAIGLIYHPQTIFIDPLLLQTQPHPCYIDGLVEMIKHAMVWDSHFLQHIQRQRKALIKRDLSVVEEMLIRNCRIKLHIVAQDGKDCGIRHILNFGHTVGHAIEVASSFQVSHGTAVALGCLVEGCLSKISSKDLRSIFHLFLEVGIPLHQLLCLSNEQIMQEMKRDKKSLKGRPRFVTLSAVGKVDSHGGSWCQTIDSKKVVDALEEVQDWIRGE